MIAAVGLAGIASAQPAADLVKKAGEEYKAGRYDAAAALLQKAYDLEPKPDTLFALAQAERLAGRCAAAIPHYKKLLAELKDLDVAKLVQSNLSLCQKDEPVVEPKPQPTPEVVPGSTTAPPTVVRVEQRSDKLALSLFATGTLAIGASVGLYIASRGNRDAAADAGTLEAHRELHDRANLQRGLAIGVSLAGLGLASYAVVRWIRPTEHRTPVLAITPSGATIGYVAAF